MSRVHRLLVVSLFLAAISSVLSCDSAAQENTSGESSGRAESPAKTDEDLAIDAIVEAAIAAARDAASKAPASVTPDTSRSEAGGTASSAVESTIEQHVVKLLVTKRPPDFFRPWTKSSPAKSSGSGVILPGRQILTNAHVVMYASQVFVQLRQGGDQLPAEVVAVAPGIDLALVRLIDSSVIKVPGLELNHELPATKSRITAYGYPTGGSDLSVTDGIVSRIEFSSFYYGTYGVRIQVDAALNPGNSGGPAVQAGKITGLVFSKIQEADNIGYLIPAEEIQTFLDDVTDGSYDGTPMLFDQIQSAENRALRDFLKLPTETTGVVVTHPYREDESYPLERWDLITRIGPHVIDNQGYVEVRPGLRLRYHYYVPRLAQDGKIALTVYRAGAVVEVEVPVSPDADLVVPLLRASYPEYFIHGPLVFTAATQEYVGAMGSRGFAVLAAINSPLLERMTDKPDFPGEELVLIATRSFPHPITKGYDNRALGVVTAVNGESVKNLRHLAELLRDNQQEFVQLDIAGRGESFVFRAEEMAAATEQILTDEGIRYRASESLRGVWAD